MWRRSRLYRVPILVLCEEGRSYRYLSNSCWTVRGVVPNVGVCSVIGWGTGGVGSIKGAIDLMQMVDF